MGRNGRGTKGRDLKLRRDLTRLETEGLDFTGHDIGEENEGLETAKGLDTVELDTGLETKGLDSGVETEGHDETGLETETAMGLDVTGLKTEGLDITSGLETVR